MILDSFDNKKYVTDDKLWGMICRANDLTPGDYSSWDENAQTLVPLLKRILARAKEVRDWQVYFYVMGKTFWFVRRSGNNDIPLAFQLSEMFHRAHAEKLAENATRFAREQYVNIAAGILHFYMHYPQIDDEKMERMLAIFLESEEKYGTDWNRGDYEKIMKAALFQHDPELARRAKKKLELVDYGSWCYVCYYVRPMLQYYVYQDDYEMVRELILGVSRKEIPKKYRWCFDKCEQANEETLVMEALQYCLELGRCELFQKIFETWQESYTHPIEGEIVTYDALFHVLAGDLSRLDEEIEVAQNDDREWREQKVTPLDAMYWMLCWYFYFRLLEKRGIETVEIDLGEESPVFEGYGISGAEEGVSGEETAAYAAETGADKTEEAVSGDEKRRYSCQAVSAYFERKADETGRKMDRARKRFDYGELKRSYGECLWSVL